ncbi:hypothetical protein HIM_02406 [Hirsutella minnesotensis 3608]|nr:hypothetical protein HIM_02406 [Hirsutella minnesotensis 3608]
MKRKAESQANGKAKSSKKAKPSLSAAESERRFRAGLFNDSARDAYAGEYAASGPYKHAVIHELVDDALLRSVRDEIRANVSFTRKETDIYRIDQSGDLANLDGLDDASLAKLPSLLALRDAVYSEAFRDYVSSVTGCGALSGRKTDMAINVYTPGCFLLCHDDRLPGSDGEVAKTPLPDPVKVIPPAWNQLSFFAVQPGESFHDVEEVYHADSPAQLDADGGRVRMAISGWFHIPQAGEPGYVEGEEAKNARNSSLMQLQGDPAQYDLPQPRPVRVENPKASQHDFDEADLEFLLKYIAPTYLTPDTLEDMLQHFEESFSISLANILAPKFARRLREYLLEQEKQALPEDSADIDAKTPWRVSRPPHKHRYLYQQPSGPDQLRTSHEESPLTELLDILLPSRQFRQWLQLATGCTVESSDVMARRFRRGKDYTLATGHDGKPRLEVNLGITPVPEAGDAAPEKDGRDDANGSKSAGKKGKSKAKRKAKEKAKNNAVETPDDDADEDDDYGGQEVYMAGDDDGDGDAAVYKTVSDADNVLFFESAVWNRLTIVLRDSGALKFVKYVNRKAPVDRWDVSGVFEIEEQDDEDEEGAEVPLGESEEEFNGFSDSPASESD